MAVKAIYVELMEQAVCPCKLAKAEEKVAALSAELDATKAQLAECQANGGTGPAVDTSELEAKIATLEQEKSDLQYLLNKATTQKAQAEESLATLQNSLNECEASKANLLPLFEVSSRGNYNTLSVEGDVIRASEGHIYFELSANMEIYKRLGYKVYGVVKTETGEVILEGEIGDADQSTALSSYSASELSHSFLSQLSGKQVANPALLKFAVYLAKDNNRIYPTNGDIPTQAVVENRD